MLNYLRYRYVKTRMAAYINGELPQVTRRFIARMIDSDRRCYAEYLRQRQIKQELERSLPIFGRAEAPQLQYIWANIQAELATPTMPEPIVQRSQLRHSWSYGLALLLCAIALILPLSYSANSHVLELPEQPSPEITATRTIAVAIHNTDDATTVALVTRPQATQDERPDLQNTPAPNTPGY